MSDSEARFMGKPIDEMSREDAIAGLKLALGMLIDANTRVNDTHEFYRALVQTPRSPAV